MNYYPFHLGDYAAHTAHLEAMEDLAYRRMLDAYYLREGPLPAEPQEVARLIRMRQHIAEVEAVLREFFELTPEGWRHSRCDEEIERMQDKQAKARASAAASVNARRAKAQPSSNERAANVEQTLNERSTDVELPTPTPTPTPKEKEKAPRKRSATPAVARPDDVAEQTWTDWLALRRAKKAPVTETVLEQARRESEKAGMQLDAFLQVWCMRGSQGLQADWIKLAERQVASRLPETFRERDERRARERWEEITGRRSSAPIDITPSAPFLEIEQ